jgi:drug/metabolite transporter (DMT)-like permease
MVISGELAALLTAVFWTITALAFESASMKVGSISVNLIRLILAMCFLSLFGWLYRGMALPTDATPHAWLWLSLSAVAGFVIGDLFLFESYTLIGSRVAMLMMTLVPPLTALAGYFFLSEMMGIMQITGMLLVLSGISLVILRRKNNGIDKNHLSRKGLLFAFIGALGQAAGLILSKYGMKDYDAFSATQIRIITGIFGFALIITFMKRWGKFASSLVNKPAMKRIVLGSFFGPFLGVSFSLLAIQHTATGIASTLMAITPILIIPPYMIIYKKRVGLSEVIGAFISVGGVALLFWK